MTSSTLNGYIEYRQCGFKVRKNSGFLAMEQHVQVYTRVELARTSWTKDWLIEVHSMQLQAGKIWNEHHEHGL
jgi:hypothetical protein